MGEGLVKDNLFLSVVIIKFAKTVVKDSLTTAAFKNQAGCGDLGR